MLWAEQSFELNSWRAFEEIDGRIAVTVMAGVVSDQSNPKPFQRSEVFTNQDIYAVERLGLSHWSFGYKGA